MTVLIAFIMMSLITLLPGNSLYARQSAFVRSPNGRLAVEFRMKAGAPSYTIRLEDKIVLSDSRLGLIRDDEDFSKNMKLVAPQRLEIIEAMPRTASGKIVSGIVRAGPFIEVML